MFSRIDLFARIISGDTSPQPMATEEVNKTAVVVRTDLNTYLCHRDGQLHTELHAGVATRNDVLDGRDRVELDRVPARPYGTVRTKGVQCTTANIKYGEQRWADHTIPLQLSSIGKWWRMNPSSASIGLLTCDRIAASSCSLHFFLSFHCSRISSLCLPENVFQYVCGSLLFLAISPYK